MKLWDICDYLLALRGLDVYNGRGSFLLILQHQRALRGRKYVILRCKTKGGSGRFRPPEVQIGTGIQKRKKIKNEYTFRYLCRWHNPHHH